jgi:3-hydroxybutyryl-CoA dehydrogenase
MPTAHRAMQTIYEQLADPKGHPSLLLKEMVAAGYLGRKPGRSAYRY